MLLTSEKFTMPSSSDERVDILVLGAGWTSKFLVRQFEQEQLSYALTTTRGTIHKSCEGRYDPTKIIEFYFDPSDEPPNPDQYRRLPTAHTIIITFKIDGAGNVQKLLNTYQKTHAGDVLTNWIQFGSTSIYRGDRCHDHESEYELIPRAVAEDELLALGGTVLNLAGLWGDERLPKNWPRKIAKSKEQLKSKGALHLIHGEDVARACVALHKRFSPGNRWIVTDRHAYDWWDLIDGWSKELEKQGDTDGVHFEYKRWIDELIVETGLTALPRDVSKLGRVLDSNKFWKEIGIVPIRLLKRQLTDDEWADAT